MGEAGSRGIRWMLRYKGVMEWFEVDGEDGIIYTGGRDEKGIILPPVNRSVKNDARNEQ